MPLNKTTTVPTDDPSAVFDEAILKLVILGDRAALVQIADNLATNPPYLDCKVVWFKNGLPASYQKKFKVPDILPVKAFSLSTANVVAATMLLPDLEDYPGVQNLYDKAGAIS